MKGKIETNKKENFRSIENANQMYFEKDFNFFF